MLEQIDLFSGLSLKELRDIEKIATRRAVLRGEVIFAQGDSARDLYLIENGQVEIVVKDYRQEFKQLAVMRSGDFFGEMALFDKDSLRSATARALQNSALIVIPGVGFERLLQEKPTISIKLLSAFSKRLRDTSQIVAKGAVPGAATVALEARVVAVASPRNHNGKSMFATTISQILAAETTRRVLLIDLDFASADATYLLGVTSPKSIVDFLRLVDKGDSTWENLARGLVRHADNFYSLPAPNNIVDGEKVRADGLIAIIKTVRKFFDYVIIDTESTINELLLNAIDLSDRVFFLVDIENTRSIRAATRYFQGLGKLNYEEQRFSLLAHRVRGDFKPDQYQKLFRYTLYGGLPDTDCSTVDFGRTLYQVDSLSPYCQVVRQAVRTVLKEAVKGGGEVQKGFFYRLFFDDQPTASPEDRSGAKNSEKKKSKANPRILESDLTALVKYINTNILYGNLDEAREQVQQLMTYCNWSSEIFQLMGEIHYLERNFSQANDALKQALVLDPDNHLAMGYLSQIGNDQALFAKAVATVEKQIAKNPEYPDRYNDLGKLWMLQGDWGKAIAAFRQALAKNPKYLEAKMHLASALGHQEDYADAIVALEEIPSKNIRVHYLLGDYYFAIGRFAESKANFQAAHEINRSYLDIQSRLQQLDEYFERLRSLIEMHQKIIRDHPEYADIHLKLGNFYMLLGQREEATAEFRRALEINPKYREAKAALSACANGDRLLDFQGAPAGPSVRTSGLTMRLEVHCPSSEEGSGRCSDNCVVAVRNLRTGKVMEAETGCRIERGSGRSQIDLSPLGAVGAGDILLVRLINRTSGQVILALPHQIDEEETIRRRIDVTLQHPAMEEATALPVRYFFVRVRNPGMAGLVTQKPRGVSVVLESERLGSKIEGTVDRDVPGEVHFILTSPKGRNAVLAGDQLHLRVVAGGKDRYRHDVGIEEADVEAFSKDVTIEDFQGLEKSANR